MKKPFVLAVLILALLAFPLLVVACGGTTTETTAGGTATTAAPTETTAAPTDTTTAAGSTETTAAAATETIRIGAVIWTQWPLGYDMKRGVDVMVALDNANGGIQIGDKKYKVEFDFVESNNDQATTMSGLNKLIHEDKVQFLITDTMYPSAVFAETERNKVVTLTGCPIPTMFDPELQVHVPRRHHDAGHSGSRRLDRQEHPPDQDGRPCLPG